MRTRGSVFVLAFDGKATHALATALRRLGWAVCVFDTWEGVFDSLQVEAPDILVLHGSHAEAIKRIATLGRAAPAVATVWHVSGMALGERIAALDAGADVCAQAGMDALEWDALLRGLYRRGLRGSSPWRLDPRGGVLAGPAGERLPLTPAERAFFVQLLNAPGHRLRREGFFPSDPSGIGEGARRVDVLVSRLRSKARSLDIELPVLAVRGWGYMLQPD